MKWRVIMKDKRGNRYYELHVKEEGLAMRRLKGFIRLLILMILAVIACRLCGIICISSAKGKGMIERRVTLSTETRGAIQASYLRHTLLASQTGPENSGNPVRHWKSTISLLRPVPRLSFRILPGTSTARATSSAKKHDSGTGSVLRDGWAIPGICPQWILCHGL